MADKPVSLTAVGGKAADPLPDKDELPILSRRNFLKAPGVAAAGAIGLTAANCAAPEPEHTLPNATVSKIPLAQQYPTVPYPPAEPPPIGVLKFFTPQEAQMVEALTVRILPGTPADPGAREAGVVYYFVTGAALYPQNPGMNPTGHLLAHSYLAGDGICNNYLREPNRVIVCSVWWASQWVSHHRYAISISRFRTHAYTFTYVQL